MMDIVIKDRSDIPLYKQIIEQIKRLVATYQLKPGEHIPTVRALSKALKINPATVARAYQELEQQGILGASRRRGTIVIVDNDSTLIQYARQSRLSSGTSSFIIDFLSQGYTPEEMEAAFTLQLARWRIERENRGTAESAYKVESKSIIHIVGSNDLALELLVNRLKQSNPQITVQITAAGSLGGLLAIQGGTADMAGIHLLDEETGEYNYPYIKHILVGIEVAVVHLADRIQGFMLAKGNPKNINKLEDLNRSDINFVNRQKGSGTRVWLDYKLRELGIQPNSINGYKRELDTHLAVAMTISRGQADAGLGIQAAANSCNLDFIPLTKERFDLVIPIDKYKSRLFAPLLEIIKSQDFKQVVNEMGGYDISQTGDTITIK